METKIKNLTHIQSEFLSLKDVAGILGISTQTVVRLPDLQFEKFVGNRRIHRKVFVDFLNANSPHTTYIDPGYQPTQQKVR